MSRVTDDDVRWLLKLVEDEQLDEVEVTQDDERVLVKARSCPSATTIMQAPAAAATPVAAAPVAEAPAPAGVPVASPMTGIFYASPSPDADPFVEVGDKIEPGQVVALIEAMKLFNDVPSPVGGVVMKIVVENEDRIEADQILMYVQPVLAGS